ncbi:TetR/AcrR family transcriptional regulator [Ktedonosporobacter rubrisoli]|uniref:TetR/AcrR family transcriptional regulator n=1 Tax=Ktedonosporobacter rubrisoli TaxID=2509675 RepID=UPI0013EEA4C1|nr:TetR family transcriptional regulator [Ktedonosporobacter rubrisoli]
MSERRKGRTHDAEGAKEAIINAAEQAFADKGFSGARIDAIAEASGYNKSLIFHYFEDKLGLYSAVIKHIKEHGEDSYGHLFASYASEEVILRDVQTFRTFLAECVRISFDFFVAHPNVLRIFTWEMAEGWHTFNLMITRFNRNPSGHAGRLFRHAQERGYVRPTHNPAMLVVMALGICQFYLTSIPRYQAIFKDEDFTSPEALAEAREQITEFVVRGIMADS